MDLVALAVFAVEVVIVLLGVLAWQWAAHVRTLREGRLRWTGSTTINVDNSRSSTNIVAAAAWTAERLQLTETAEYWRAACDQAKTERDAARRLLALRVRSDFAVDTARVEKDSTQPMEIVPVGEETIRMRAFRPPAPPPGTVISLEEWRPVRRTPPPFPPLVEQHNRVLESVR